jgi:mannosyl-oligosaccharide glucosidase
LDDYPRSEEHLGDLHLDLQCWMIYYAKTMKNVAKTLGKDFEKFDKDQQDFTKGLELFWDKGSKSFTDLTFTENEELVHVVHKGYITLFPLLLGILKADDKRIGILLDLVRNPKEMWSDFGILSLSRTDQNFGKDENYWRGPIWININYLLLQCLKRNYIGGKYGEMAQVVYTELRENLFRNVYDEYKRTGFVWEQYDPSDGHGKGCHPFTGWSSLILLVMAEKY